MASNVENSTPTKNKKAKVHAAASWEWFKSAAWLQVLLIVGVVVGIVISIPYIVTGIKNLSKTSEITFYSDHRINYDQFQKFINGEDKECNGTFGDGEGNFSSDTEGFGVLFYKDNCDHCSTMQSNISTWFDSTNNKANGKLKLYTINVGWVPGDSTTSTTNESLSPSDYYKNDGITLDQQYDLMQDFRDVYLAQKDLYQNTSINASTFEVKFATGSSNHTIPTPLFVTFSKKTSDTKYDITNPNKVVFTVLNGYSETSKDDINRTLMDIYNISIASEKNTTSTSSSSAS